MATDTPIDFQKLRLDGVYRMNERDELMLRIKVPAGVLSVAQAAQVADLADAFAGGRLHLTTRGSIELHRVRARDLAAIGRGLAAVGLTSRGACGGAVRGIACSASFSPNFVVTQALARRLHRHFAGNPHFEGLPKKFKIAVEDGYAGARHLIQDAGIVFTGHDRGANRFDVWVAGGLGREPQAAFQLAENLAEEALIPLIEAVVRTYVKHTPAGKRLKHLVRSVGEVGLRRLLEQERAGRPTVLAAGGLDGTPAPAGGGAPVTAFIFAGDLDTATLRQLIEAARSHSGGFLAVTADQNLAFAPAAEARAALVQELAAAGFVGTSAAEKTAFRVCVGSHACRMGLSPTRDLARAVLDALPPAAQGLEWAISGCPNSCSQPQLAPVGIVTSRLAKEDGGERTPRFDIYRRTGEGLGEKCEEGLNLQQLLQFASRVAE